MYYPTLKEFIKKSKKGNLIPVYKEILADFETPVSALRKIDTGDYAYLLESAEQGERLGRYSFLGSNPSLVFQSKGNRVEITRGGKKKARKTSNPLLILKELMAGYKFVPARGLPRFAGGMVGYLSYDMVRFFEKLPQKKPDDLHLPDAVFLLTDTLLIFDHLEHKIKVISNAHIKKNPKKAYREATGKIERVIDQLRHPGSPPGRPCGRKIKHKKITIKSNHTKEAFKKSVKRAKNYIKEGEAVQIVLSQRLETKITVAPFDIYRALRTLNPSPYMYYLKCKDLKLIGSSPEILVRLEDGVIEVRPIAGTRPRGKRAREDKLLEQELLGDPKEKAEHIMLVDLGRNDVGRVAEYGSVKVNELMTIEKYSHVMHIVSDITGKLVQGEDSLDVLQASFPAGTVSGAPKVRAMEIIEELEPTRRGPYAGAVGYFSFSGNLDTCITIRTIVVKGNQAYVQAGAGIVADSVPEKEYQETINKAKALVKAIEMAQRGLV
jgi:anthranilate synthase component 1